MGDVGTNVVLPAEVLAGTDTVAGHRQRSRFLAEAAREKLSRIRFERAAERAFGCWTDADHPELTGAAGVGTYLQRLREPADQRPGWGPRAD